MDAGSFLNTAYITVIKGYVLGIMGENAFELRSKRLPNQICEANCDFGRKHFPAFAVAKRFRGMFAQTSLPGFER